MLGKVLRVFGMAQMILAALALALVIGEPSARRYGDRLQIALPLLAWGCAAVNRSGTEFFARFMGMLAVAHGSKRSLGEIPLNTRPSGSPYGFPSAHAAAATIGASSLVQDCIPGKRGVAGVVLIAAGFVGASRIEANAHDVWQVLAGTLLGWGADRVLRRNQRARAAIRNGWLALRGMVARGLAAGRRGIAAVLEPILRPPLAGAKLRWMGLIAMLLVLPLLTEMATHA